jgi:UDP-N-acetylmuramoyl-L-alanyl-D-glutamate--2,6-diaminopimelate ligase
VKNLKDIVEGIEIVSQSGSSDVQIFELVFDSRKAKEGTAFFAIKGSAVDGHDFIPAVIEAGCKVLFTDHAVEVPAEVTLIVTENTSKSLALAATIFYNHPSKNLKLVGVTGTNGKTTTTTLLFNLYTKLGFHCGLLSTVVNKIGDQAIASTHTTPDPVSLNALLAQMVEDGCSHCFLSLIHI